MLLPQLVVLSALTVAHAQETVLGAFVFHRHGDRTPKYFPPPVLTDLGYVQIYGAGDYYRNRYITNKTTAITGIKQDVVKLSEIDIESPVDILLQTSGIGWLQGLYPPVGAKLSTQTLANGTVVQAPLNGYQLIPLNQVTSTAAATPENNVWLQGGSGCANAVISSNNYFISQEYNTTKAKTDALYQSIYPIVNNSFPMSYMSYKNAYSIWDVIHVATINNKTINSSELLTPDTFNQLTHLAYQHEWGLAYNATEPIRSIAGATLAAQIVAALTNIINTKSATKLSVQWGAYASFLAFFGLAQLPAVSDDFTGVVDYASSMAFELITTADTTKGYPTVDQISVRFSFTNGSAALTGGLKPYPLFGMNQLTLPWNTYVAQMNKIAIGDQMSWCQACGNTTGVCAPASSSAPASSPTAASSGDSGSSLSNPVAGVIGAMVTLAVIFGIGALIFLVGGLRLVSKKRMAAAGATHSGSDSGSARNAKV